MREFPLELIYFLFFIALFLFQWLRKMAARQAEKVAPAEVVASQSPAASFDESMEPRAPAAWAALPISTSDFGRRSPSPVPVRTRQSRRFSRQSLFGTPQDVEKAVVLATILGPCRALDPAASEPRTERARSIARRA